MKLKVKLYATLNQYLPEDAIEHGTFINVEPTATPHSVIDSFRVPREMAYLILLNGIYVSPDDREQPVFKDGDTLAIWPPVAGG